MAEINSNLRFNHTVYSPGMEEQFLSDMEGRFSAFQLDRLARRDAPAQHLIINDEEYELLLEDGESEQEESGDEVPSERPKSKTAEAMMAEAGLSDEDIPGEGKINKPDVEAVLGDV